MILDNCSMPEMIGQRYDQWLVLSFAGMLTINDAGRSGGRKRVSSFLCKCDCGTERIVIANSLRKGASRSCGCLRIPASIAATTKHGATFGGKPTKTYCVWQAMWARCTNQRNAIYHYYGGRGITVCEEWRDYAAFRRDMGDQPEGLTLDRINNGAGYSKRNCRWTTMAEQNKNKRPYGTCTAGPRSVLNRHAAD